MESISNPLLRNRGLSATTIKHYTASIQAIERLCKTNRGLINATEVDTIFPVLYFTNPEGIVGALMSAQPSYQLSSLISMMSAILWHMRTNVASCLGADESLNEFHLFPYITHRDYLQAVLDTQIHDRKGDLSSKEKKNYLAWIDVENTYRKRMTGIGVRGLVPGFDAVQDFVIASLYVLQPPIRADYANMRVFLSSEEVPGDFRKNHFVLDPPMFVLYEYKNAGRGGVAKEAHVNPVCEELRDILSDWLCVNPSDWLLITRKGRDEILPMTENALSSRVRSIFKRWIGRAASINTLRHAYVSHLRDTGAGVDTKRDVAAVMMHAVTTSEKYVRKPKGSMTSLIAS